jgi:hypothetical protein
MARNNYDNVYFIIFCNEAVYREVHLTQDETILGERNRFYFAYSAVWSCAQAYPKVNYGLMDFISSALRVKAKLLKRTRVLKMMVLRVKPHRQIIPILSIEIF